MNNIFRGLKVTKYWRVIGDEIFRRSKYLIFRFKRWKLLFVITIWRQNSIFVTQYHLYLHFGDEIWFSSPNVMNVVNMVPKMIVSWFFFFYDLGNENQFVAQCNLYLQFDDETSFLSPIVISIYNLVTKIKFRCPM